MIIDAHAHVWPPHIAAEVLAAKPVGLEPMGDGTLEGLAATMEAAGIDHACTLAIANTARTVRRTNEFVGGVDRRIFTPFGTVHPDLTIDENLASLDDNGITAVKFHPIFQQASLADPRVVDLMRALADRGIVVLTHAGAGGDDPDGAERGHPRHVAGLVTAVPDLTLIACHYGGYHLLDEAEREVVGRRVILETSWPPAVADLDPGRVRDLIREHGSDRVVFGSDWPMANPAAEIATIRSWGLSASEADAVLGGTLAAVLGLDDRIRP